MRILQNLGVHGHERRIQNTRCRDDDLVGWVAVKSAGKLCGLDADAGRKLDEADTGIRQRLLNPVEHRARQRKPSALDELGDLPARNRAHAEAGLLGGIEHRARGSGKRGIAVNPPDPDVRIEDKSPGSLPVGIRHGFSGREERDRGAAKRVARAGRGNGSKRKDDDLDGLAATKGNVAQSDDAILGQSSFDSVCLHGRRIKSLRFRSKRAKLLTPQAHQLRPTARVERKARPRITGVSERKAGAQFGAAPG